MKLLFTICKQSVDNIYLLQSGYCILIEDDTFQVIPNYALYSGFCFQLYVKNLTQKHQNKN